MDWQVGDLALCICDRACPILGNPGFRRGGVYTVSGIVAMGPGCHSTTFGNFSGRYGLTLIDVWAPAAIDPRRFVKVTPGTEPIGIEEPRRRILELHND